MFGFITAFLQMIQPDAVPERLLTPSVAPMRIQSTGRARSRGAENISVRAPSTPGLSKLIPELSPDEARIVA
jgi:hypothetical protein